MFTITTFEALYYTSFEPYKFIWERGNVDMVVQNTEQSKEPHHVNNHFIFSQ